MGAYLKQRLNDERKSLPTIGAVRGKGLMVAADMLGIDGKLMDAKGMKQIMSDISKNNVVLTKCGASSLRFAPALNITKPQVDEALESIFGVLHELHGRV